MPLDTNNMGLESIAEKLEENSEAWTRGDRKLEKKKGIRLYQPNTFKRQALNALLGVATAAFCSYLGYKIVNSGADIIERYIDNISVFYLED